MMCLTNKLSNEPMKSPDSLKPVFVALLALPLF